MYEGHWAHGEPAGKGRRWFADGAFYVGEWNDGQLDGRGLKFLRTGHVYEGQFLKGQKHGRGRERICPAVVEAIEDMVELSVRGAETGAKEAPLCTVSDRRLCGASRGVWLEEMAAQEASLCTRHPSTKEGSCRTLCVWGASAGS